MRITKKYIRSLGLYQIRPNSIWFTDKPIFSCETGKQIERGFEIMFPYFKRSFGIFDPIQFQKKIQILFTEYDYDFFYIRMIESKALPIKKTKKQERGKITYKLRYQILKRNKFRCKSCGKSASEIELEIDHIVPISKGGLTIESNLQALCVECNRGKNNN